MSHTRGTYFQDTALTDGKIFISPTEFTNTGAGTAPLTVNAKGDVSLNAGASQTLVFSAFVSKLIERLGMNFISGEQFGTAAGVAGISSVANTSDADGGPAGIPSGNSTASQLTPRTSFIPKGIQINDVTMLYSITGAALTTHTFGLSKTVFPVPGTPAALVITDIIAPGANGLATATNANPQSTKIPVVAPVMNVTDESGLIIAYDVTTQVAGAFRLYGAVLHVSFNFN